DQVATDVLDEAADADVTRLADVDDVVDELRAADGGRLTHHPDQRIPQLVVRRDPVPDDREVRLEALDPHQLRDGPMDPVVLLDEVGDGAAVRVAAWQGNE